MRKPPKPTCFNPGYFNSIEEQKLRKNKLCRGGDINNKACNICANQHNYIFAPKRQDNIDTAFTFNDYWDRYIRMRLGIEIVYYKYEERWRNNR